MPHPTVRLENQLRRLHGFRHIAGVDEAGRGALAGPIAAAAAVMPAKQRIPGVTDSKLLSRDERERLYDIITVQAIAWSFAVVSAEYIDAHGIQAANVLVMQQAVAGLSVQPDHVITDWLDLNNHGIICTPVTDGDAKVYCVAAASIIAKVGRDRLMYRYHEQFPAYGFASHVGYGTPEHHATLTQYGPCMLHRRSFLPVRMALERASSVRPPEGVIDLPRV